MSCYAVIDTNVLVSGLLSENDTAATVQVLGRMIAGEITPLYSDEIIAEYREVLSRKKFKFSSQMIEYLLSVIDKYGILIEPTLTGIVLPDMKDLPFYEVVLEKKNDGAYLITGNAKHFPEEPFIVSARQMIDILDNNVSPT